MAAFTQYEFPPGFCMEFPNGWSVSVAWGNGNYCSNRGQVGNLSTSDTTAEVAVWYGERNSKVFGWCGAEEVAGLIAKAAAGAFCRCCGAGMEGSDHCPECGCEQFEESWCAA